MARKSKKLKGKKDAGKCRQDELKQAQEKVKALSGKKIYQLDAGDQVELLNAVCLMLGLVDDKGVIK